MARIAFYIDTRRVRSADIRDVDAGNPGIGGTEYMFFLVATRLARKHRVTMYVTASGRYPPGIRYVVVRDMQDAAVAMWSRDEEIVVLRENEVVANMALLCSMQQKILVWAHNFSRPETLQACARVSSIVRYVCVSREQRERLRNEDLFAKAVCIYNGIPTAAYPTGLPEPAGDNVFFMGSLVRSKGFHTLARHWNEIAAAVPTARLHVVGSGRLWNESQTLGPLGLASAEYEREFAGFITERGRLRHDVAFHGVLGADKWRVLSQAKVAVAIAPRRGETFCLAAVEFGALGVPFVTRRIGGPIDVVENGVSGVLYDDESQLPGVVIGLLKGEERRREMGRAATAIVRSSFDIEVVMPQWERTIAEVLAGTPVADSAAPGPQRLTAVDRLKSAAVAGRTMLVRPHVRHSPLVIGRAWLGEKLLDRHFALCSPWPARIASTRFGFRLHVHLPDVVENAIYISGRWERAVTDFVRRTLRPGDVFIDVGAGVGYYSLLASRLVGRKGRVYSIERRPRMIQRLRENVALNGVVNVEVVEEESADLAGGVSHRYLIDRVPEEQLLDARLIRIDIESEERAIVEPLLPRLPEFARRTIWAFRMLPGLQGDKRSDACWLFNAFVSHGYQAFALPLDYTVGDALAGTQPTRLVPLEEPPTSHAEAIFIPRSSKPVGVDEDQRARADRVR